MSSHLPLLHSFFFFNDTATTEIYTLSLHDALPISSVCGRACGPRRPSIWLSGGSRSGSLAPGPTPRPQLHLTPGARDRKSTRLNSSHGYISYAVFCLKKKKKRQTQRDTITHNILSI